MTPLGVVEHLDLVEDIGSGIVAGSVGLAADAFALEQLEETLGHGLSWQLPRRLMLQTRL